MDKIYINKIYNESIASKITQEQYDKIEEEIDFCVREAMTDRMDTKGRTRLYNVDFESCEGSVEICDEEPIIDVDGVGLVLISDIDFDYDAETYGDGWHEERWTEITRYHYNCCVTLADIDGEPVIDYDFSRREKY